MWIEGHRNSRTLVGHVLDFSSKAWEISALVPPTDTSYPSICRSCSRPVLPLPQGTALCTLEFPFKPFSPPPTTTFTDTTSHVIQVLPNLLSPLHWLNFLSRSPDILKLNSPCSLPTSSLLHNIIKSRYSLWPVASKHFTSVWGVDGGVWYFLSAILYTPCPKVRFWAFFSAHEMYSQVHTNYNK